MSTIKLVLRVEIEEEQLKDILESYDVKGTKKNMAKLKRDLKENDADDQIAMNLSGDIENEIGEWISGMDWEDNELVKE